MEETTEKRGKTNLLWVLVLVAIVVLWWWFRPEGAHHPRAALDQDVPAATADGADPDDILVDLKDSATAAQVAALEHDLGIDLVLVADPEAKGQQLYRAHVAPSAEA